MKNTIIQTISSLHAGLLVDEANEKLQDLVKAVDTTGKAGTDNLVFWFELIRPDRVFKEAIAEEIKHIQEQTGCTLYYGTAGI